MSHHIALKTALLSREGHEWLKRQCTRVVYSAVHVLRLLDDPKYQPLPLSSPPSQVFSRYQDADASLTQRDMEEIDELFNNGRILLGTAWFDRKYTPSRDTSADSEVDDWLNVAYDKSKKEAVNTSYFRDYVSHARQEPKDEDALLGTEADDKSFGEIVKDVLANLWEEPKQ